MGTASRHFSWAEFACKCASLACEGKRLHTAWLLLVGLEELHERLARVLAREIRILVNSGNRCRSHDLAERRRYAQEHGLPPPTGTGEHAEFWAADVVVQARTSPSGEWGPVPPDAVSAEAEECPVWRDGKGGIGTYSDRNHLDVRSGPGARWRG